MDTNTFFLLLPFTMCLLSVLASRPRRAGAESGPEEKSAGDGEQDADAIPATSDALRRQSALLRGGNKAALLLFSDEEDFDALAVRALEVIGEVTGVDLVDVWRNHDSVEEGLLCTQVYCWNRRYASGRFSPYANTAVYNANLPGWKDELSSGRSVDTRRRLLSPQENEHLEQQGLQAVLAVPIVFRSSFWGLIRLGVRTAGHDWSKGEEAVLSSVGLLLAATMQRRQIQEALAESEERFRDVTMAAGEIIWELNAQGYFSYISERVAALAGYLPEEVLGWRWEDLAPDDQDEELTGRMFQASVPSGSFRALEHRIKSKDGKEIWLFTSGKLLFGPDGIGGLRGTSLDITHDKRTAANLNQTLKELEKANKELEASAERSLELARKAESVSKAKSEFLANMSHEVRTPLNAVIGMAYLMRKTSLSPKQEDYLNKIHAAGVTLLRVVNDILDFSKIESGKLELERTPFELASLFETVAFVVGGKAEEQGLDVVFSIRRDVPRRLIGDSLRMGQVLTNLVGNAVKFTKRGGIDVRCELEKIENNRAHLRFIVHDTGIGISEEQRRLLFQSFSQVDSSITRKYGGTGLGLAISKNLLQLAGGDLSLESVPGEGTTITVRLPFDVDSARADVSGPEDSLADLSVTLVDPSDIQRAHLFDMLQTMGCKVAAFSDMGKGFAAIAGADAPDSPLRVLILPMSLADENNGSNIRYLYETMLLANVPRVLAVAPFGFSSEQDEEVPPKNSLRHEMCIVTRPVISTSLAAALADVLAGTERKRRKSGVKDCPMPYFPEGRVLLVEDNPVNQQIAMELLREAGISAALAENGRIAVELLENNPDVVFDLVFMDLQMPEMDGFTAVARIRANPRLAFLPIIAMTAHATVDERLRCLEAGMNEHLSKPIDVAVFHDILRLWLKSARERNALFGSPYLDDSPLPDLPGLDAQNALERMNGDLLLYKTHLLQFQICHTDTVDDLREALVRNEQRKVLRIISSALQHARVIGAGRLAEAAAVLEAPLACEQPIGEADVRDFLAELAVINDLLARVYPQLPPGDRSDIDRRAFLAELTKLNTLLNGDAAAACQFFASLEPAIRKVSASVAAKAAEALAVFDFSQALSVLGLMEKSLASELAVPDNEKK